MSSQKKGRKEKRHLVKLMGNICSVVAPQEMENDKKEILQQRRATNAIVVGRIRSVSR